MALTPLTPGSYTVTWPSLEPEEGEKMRPYNYIVYDREEGLIFDEGVLIADGEKNAEYKAIEKAQAEGDDFELSDPSLVVKVVPFG